MKQFLFFILFLQIAYAIRYKVNITDHIILKTALIDRVF